MSTTISSNRHRHRHQVALPLGASRGPQICADLIAANHHSASWLLGWDELGFALMLGVTIWVAAFFRDPVRVTPTGSTG
jgi:phosphatidylserine decarboxylase